MVQTREELEVWHQQKDPWGYEENADDVKRRDILLSELPEYDYQRVLDIGCGQGFVTRHLPGKSILGVDISAEAIKHTAAAADAHLSYRTLSLFELPEALTDTFDLIVLTGVLYPQYVGRSLTLVYLIIDRLLGAGGVLAGVHINDWYQARFPYLLLRDSYYNYREYIHRLEIYQK